MYRSLTKLVAFSFLILSYVGASGQDDLDALLDGIEEVKIEYVTGAFKSTRVINLQSIELVSPVTLDFRISHRFGALDGGGYELFGLDQATMRMSLEYGLNKSIMFGIGRSTYEKTIDGFVKVRLLRQSSFQGKTILPFTAVYFTSVTINGLHWQDPERANYFTSRLAYTHQLIIGSKINIR